MQQLSLTAATGTTAVKKLREQKLRKGLPFMINVRELASNCCYMEYPDGRIELVMVTRDASTPSVVRVLTPGEAASLRKRLHLSA